MNADIADANVPAAGTPSAAPAVPIYSWYVLALLTLIYMFHSVDRGILSIVMEPLRLAFNLDDSRLGIVVGLAFGIPYALAGLPMGVIIDRVNRRNFLSAILALWSLFTMLCGYAQSYTQLVLLRLTVGAAEAGTPTTHALVTDYFAAEKRPMALGLLMAGGTLAYVLIFAVGGWVAQSWGWRSVFAVAGLPGVIIALLFFLTVREPVRGATEKNRPATAEPAPPFLQTIGFLFSLRSFRHLFTGYVLVTMSVSGYWAWIGSLLIRVHGLPVRDAGLSIAMGAGLGSFFGAVLGAVIAGRLGRHGAKAVLTFIAVTAGAAAPFGIAMAFAPWLPVALVCMALVGAIKCSYVGPSQGLFLTLAKVRMRGVTAALLNVAGSLIGGGIGPLIAGVISDAVGGNTAIRFGLAAVFLLDAWAAVHFWVARRSFQNDLESVSR